MIDSTSHVCRARRSPPATLVGRPSRAAVWMAAAVLLAISEAGASAQIVDGRDRDSPPSPPTPSRTPGFLRPISELRPVGGDIRPVGGGIRPVGGNLGPSGSDLRPVEITSPLANDRSFDARTRPNTTAAGVTGFAIEPGWDDPPWPDAGDRSGSGVSLGGSRRSRSSSSSGVAMGGDGSSGPVGQVLLPGRFSAGSGTAPPVVAGASVVGANPAPPSPAAGPVANRPPVRRSAPASASAGVAAASLPAGAADRDWFDTGEVKPQRARSGDIRPDLRLAARLTTNGQQAGAVDVVRHAVYQQPEAFSAAQVSLFESDPAAQERIRLAIAEYTSPGHARVSQVDAAFMVAALSAAIGDSDAAVDAIRSARQLGETRASGKALHRVLTRPQPQPVEVQP